MESLLKTRRRIMENPQPRTVIWNQLAKELNSENYSTYNTTDSSVTFSDGIATLTFLTSGGTYRRTFRPNDFISLTQGDKMYLSYMCNPSMANQYFDCEYCGVVNDGVRFAQNEYGRFSDIRPAPGGTTGTKFLIPNRRSGDSSTTQGLICLVKAVFFVNLTLMFGAGNEPATTDEFERQCVINGIDINNQPAYNSGTPMPWVII